MKQFLATASDLVGKKQQLPVHVNQENRIQEKSQNGFVKRRNDLLSCKNQAGIFLYAKRNSLLIKMPRIWQNGVILFRSRILTNATRRIKCRAEITRGK